MAFTRKDFQHWVFLGEGGEASVYRAYQTSVNRIVAIREIKPSSQAHAEQEAKVLSSLRHQGLAVLIDFGYENGRFYMVQDYVRGASPMDFGVMPALAAIQSARYLAKTLQFLHSKGFVHGDLHPGNLLFPSASECVLVDFGMVRRIGEASQEALGAPRYFAPEHFLGKPFAASADIFSFGSLLYFLLTGRELFMQSSFEEIASAVLQLESTEARKALALKWLDLPTEIFPVMERCLQFDPELRFEDMDELEENLEIAENKIRERMGISEASTQMMLTDASIQSKVAERERLALENAYKLAHKNNQYAECQWILHELLASNPQDSTIHARLRLFASGQRKRSFALRFWTIAGLLLLVALGIFTFTRLHHQASSLDEMGQDLAIESRLVDSPEEIARSKMRPVRLVTIPAADRFEIILIDSVSQPLENDVLRIHIGRHRFLGKIRGQKEWKSAIIVVPEAGPTQIKWLR